MADIIARIDEMIAALKREKEKPFTGAVWSPIEALEIVKSMLLDRQ